MRTAFLATALSAAVLVAACAGDPPRTQPGLVDRTHPGVRSPGESLLRFDANKDGSVTTAEFNAGLRAEFAAADTNRDGVLDLAEMRAVNAARLKDEGSMATPLIDWNQDGHIDLQEFSAAPKSLFTQIDLNGDGTLDPDEINPHPRQHHRPPPMMAPYGVTPL